jgi:hypothetical protein
MFSCEKSGRRDSNPVPTTWGPPHADYLMSGKRGSNPRPLAWEANALPTELLPHLNLLYFLFHKNKDVPSIEFNGRWIKISDKQRYFNGPVTELRRVDIYDKGLMNIMNITYENINNNHLSEISIPIPKGKLKEAIDAHERLMNNRTNL